MQVEHDHRFSSEIDDMVVTEAATTERASRATISSSLTANSLPQLPPQWDMHVEVWPQDRPIARALSSGMANSFV